jgi:hypothetical protein
MKVHAPLKTLYRMAISASASAPGLLIACRAGLWL